MDKTYKIEEEFLKNNWEWTDKRWLTIQILMELVNPKGYSYIFDKDSLLKSLLSINIMDIFPYYHDSYEPKQSELEKKKIVTFYIRELGFPQPFLSDSFKLDKFDATNVVSNILRLGTEQNLIKSID